MLKDEGEAGTGWGGLYSCGTGLWLQEYNIVTWEMEVIEQKRA